MAKRIWVFFFTGFVLLFAGLGCNPKQAFSASVTLKEPPVLQLQYVIEGEKMETVIFSGNYEWYYQNEDGTSTGGIACGGGLW